MGNVRLELELLCSTARGRVGQVMSCHGRQLVALSTSKEWMGRMLLTTLGNNMLLHH